MKSQSSFRRLAFALGCVFAFVTVPAIHAADVAATPRADHKALPITTAFEKDSSDKGPIVLKITNTSAATIKLEVAVAESVLTHAKARNRKHDYTIEAGKSDTVTELAVGDKVTISAEGHETLHLEVKG